MPSNNVLTFLRSAIFWVRKLVISTEMLTLRMLYALGYSKDRTSWKVLAMSITISDEILQASQLTPDEFCQEIALHFFQTGRLTLGYASQLAGMSPNTFRQLLKQHQIPLYSYDVEDFELDLKTLRELGRLRSL